MKDWIKRLLKTNQEKLPEPFSESKSKLKILRRGPATRVIFFYLGEEGTFIDHVFVTLFENGIVHIQTPQEQITTHLRSCEILWKLNQNFVSDRGEKLQLVKGKEKRSLESVPTFTDPDTPLQ